MRGEDRHVEAAMGGTPKHPHVRGEDKIEASREGLSLETPPRAWGRPRNLVRGCFQQRNTPTCVGKTIGNAVIVGTVEKHPHVRGEDLSSLFRSFLWLRNTPTCVGKTITFIKKPLDRGKHPHVRGEDESVICGAAISLETPPRAWGRLRYSCFASRWRGNTPTCVGKTGAMAVQ